MKDYALYIVLRAVIFFMRLLPLSAWLSLAKGAGWLYYYFASKKNKKAYSNLKIAFPEKNRKELNRIIHRMYGRFAQNLVEAFYLPYMDDGFIMRHVRMPDKGVVENALKENRGIIFLGSHAGSWEVSNIACAVAFSAEGGSLPDRQAGASGGKNSRYAMLAQPQSRFARLDAYLNALREKKGCSVIRVTELKRIFEHLSGNNILGSVADHGGKDGIPVEFFSKLAMTPTGGVKLSKKLGSKIILAFMRRAGGPYHELYFKPYEIVSTGDEAGDLKLNLTRINKIFENWIAQYPEEYLWFYKRWKYSPQKNVLILSDSKAGHVKQSLALVDMMKGLGFEIKSEVVEIRPNRPHGDRLLTLVGFLFGPGATRSLLGSILDKATVSKLMRGSFDTVISCGSSLAAINLAIASENSAKAISIMKPSIFGFSNFNLVIMPKHDRPPRAKNVLPVIGSINAIDGKSLETDYQRLVSSRGTLKGLETVDKPRIGLLIGGDSKNYTVTADAVAFLCDQLKKALDDLDGYLLLTTSRRTPKEAVETLKAYFKDDPRCRLFVVAAQDNPAGTVGGIFYLSHCVIVTGESISMVSEAASCGKYVIVFEPHYKGRGTGGASRGKVGRFLDQLAQKQYIHLVKLNEIYDKLTRVLETKPPRFQLNTRTEIIERLKDIL